jgi:acyl carrier protein
LLHVEAAEVLLPDSGQWLDWTALDSSELRLRDRLAQPGQSWLGVASIPNKRLANDIVALEKLQDAGVATTTDVIKKELSGYESTAADPFKLRHLADETGYQLELSYSGSGAEGRMDALFRKSSREDCDSHVFWPVHVTPEEASWHTYANNPLKGKLARAMIPQLKEDLKLNLPEYMVPSVFVLLDVLPLSANGKVDRRSLPMPGDARANLDAEYTAPRNEIEEQLIQIWIEVLKLEQVGVFDDFFDLGGHSLLATQVISRLREKMEINLPLSEMFGYPTVAGLAQKIEMIHWVNQEPVMENNIDEREVFKL